MRPANFKFYALDTEVLFSKRGELRQKSSEQIHYCYNCQPADGGGYFWILGDRIDMHNLLWGCGIPEGYQSGVADQLSCPNCGTELDLTCEVGLQTNYEAELSKREKTAKSIYTKEIKSFEDQLQEFPMLALRHKFARKINKAISEHKLPVTTLEGKFYRARRLSDDKIFNKKDMLHAPIGKPTDGRFNHAGQSHLYLSTEKETAMLEVIESESMVWYCSVKIEKPIDKILDLDINWNEESETTPILLHALNINRSIQRSDRNKGNWRPDYYMTKFIMDCAKSSGYNGIKYLSAKFPPSYNYVLFYPEKVKIKNQGKPKVIEFKKPKPPKLRSDLFF
jgi:hypothetical protein